MYSLAQQDSVVQAASEVLTETSASDCLTHKHTQEHTSMSSLQNLNTSEYSHTCLVFSIYLFISYGDIIAGHCPDAYWDFQVLNEQIIVLILSIHH